MTGVTLAKKPLALIIEDNELIVEILKKALEQAEYEVDQIQDGRLAIEQLARVTPALILLDLHLPYVSGEKILEFIRTEERLAHTRVILASADLPKAASLAHRVDFVMAKPFSFFDLRDLAVRLHPAKTALK